MTSVPTGERPTANEPNVWLYIGRALECDGLDLARALDEWEETGVTGLLVGRLGHPHPLGRTPAMPPPSAPRPIFAPDPAVYRRWEVPPPEPDPTGSEAVGPPLRRLKAALDAARRRGMRVLAFEAAGLAGRAPLLTAGLTLDDSFQRAYLARMEDTLAHFPECEGTIVDGPEWGYEIEPGHRSCLLDDLPPEMAPAVAARGYDFQQLCAARDRLSHRLRSIASPPSSDIRHGILEDPENTDLTAWRAFRAETIVSWFARVRLAVNALSHTWQRPLVLGLGTRLPALAAICGHDLPVLVRHLDLLLPKLYIWHRGVDGLYGTAGRYVHTLQRWNPGVAERDLFAATMALLDLPLPAPLESGEATATRLLDLDLGFPPAFFSQVIAAQTRCALDAVGGRNAHRIIPWVDAGPRPHGGDSVGAGDLFRLLTAATGAGVRRFAMHAHLEAGRLPAAHRTVLRAVCYG